MYKNTAAEIRPELQSVVEEARESEKFFIADKVLPLWPSATKSGDYRKIVKGSGGLLEMTAGDDPDKDPTLRAPRTAYKEVDRTYEKAGFTCRDRGLTEVVDDSDQADLSRFFDAESTSARLVLGNILRAQEFRAARKFMTEDPWSKVDAKVAYTEANIATIDPALDFDEAISTVQLGQEIVNTLIIPKNVWRLLKRSTLLRKFIFGENSGGKLITRQVFLEALQDSAPIENLFITESVYSKAKKGAKVTRADLKYIWPDSYIWVGNIQGGAPEMGGAGRTIYWEEDAEFNYVVETYRDEHRRSDVVRVRQHNEEHIVNEWAGAVIKTNFA